MGQLNFSEVESSRWFEAHRGGTEIIQEDWYVYYVWNRNGEGLYCLPIDLPLPDVLRYS